MSAAGAAAGSLLVGLTFPGLRDPNAIDGQRVSAGILKQSVKFPGRYVVSSDEAAGLGIASAG